MKTVDDRSLLVALLDAAVDAIIVADGSGTILRANRATAALFGHSVEAMTGQNLRMLMPAATAAAHDGYIRHHIETGERRIIGIGRDVEGMRADGSILPMHLSVGRAEIEGEIAFVGILHDQTQRRATEEAMARSQRMDAIGQMTGGIAHDFNNLLTVVIGNLELLEMAETAPKSGALIADALAAAEMGADLTSRLLIFSRKSPLLTKTIDLNEVVRRSLALLKRTIGAHCQLDSTLAETLWPTRTDPTQLQTAILNLALNAQDAMPEGGNIALETRNVVIDDQYVAQEIDVECGSYVRLSLSDTGTGMTAETRLRALEPFYSTKPVGKGTGLGLSMVYGFVRQSGGHLTIYSEPSHGTTISLYFPALVDAAGLDAVAPDDIAAAPVLGAGRTVLVVEDDPRVARLSQSRLAAFGFTCLGAATADDAWTIIAQRDDIDLVFTDLVMPGRLSGYDLARRIAAERPGIRVLLTSGFSEGMLQDGRLGPEFAMLRKPYRQADLALALEQVLARV